MLGRNAYRQSSGARRLSVMGSLTMSELDSNGEGGRRTGGSERAVSLEDDVLRVAVFLELVRRVVRVQLDLGKDQRDSSNIEW